MIPNSSKDFLSDIMKDLKAIAEFDYSGQVPDVIFREDKKQRIIKIITAFIEKLPDPGISLSISLSLLFLTDMESQIPFRSQDEHFITWLYELDDKKSFTPEVIATIVDKICDIVKYCTGSFLETLLVNKVSRPVSLDIKAGRHPTTFLMKPHHIQFASDQDLFKEGTIANPSWSFYGNVIRYFNSTSSWFLTKAAIEHLGGKVILLDETKNLRDIHVRDSAILLKGGKLISPGGGSERGIFGEQCLDHSREHLDIVKRFKAAGIDTTVITAPIMFDGGNILIHGNIALVRASEIRGGTDERPTILNKPKLEAVALMQILQRHGYETIQIIPEASMPKAFYHNDHIVSLLPKGEVLIADGYISRHTMKALESRFKGRIITADHETVRNIGLNLVAPTDTNLLMPFCSPDLKAKLGERGYSVFTPEELGIPADGLVDKRAFSGPHCFTLDVPSNFLAANQPLDHLISTRSGQSRAS